MLAVWILRRKQAYQKSSATPVILFAQYIDVAITGEL
jgi:hypothetical protein